MRSWHNDRTTIRQRIGCRTCWCTHHQSIRLIRRQIVAIYGRMNGNHRGIVTFQYRYIVQCTAIAFQRLSVRLHLDDSSGIYRIVTLIECINGTFYLLGLDISQES